MTIKTTIAIIACSLFLSACIRPFQPDVQQGNILNNSDLKEIRYGMSKQEVLFILGTPMVIDPFNEQRWDYFYSKNNKRKKETDTRLITAMFDGDKLVELKGDVDLSNVQSLEPSIEDQQHGGTVVKVPTQRRKGLFYLAYLNVNQNNPMSTYPKAFDQMLAAWNEADPKKIRAHLDAALHPQVHFVDPTIDVTGIDEFEKMVHEVQAKAPGAVYSRVSAVDSHHNLYRYHWAIHVDGKLAIQGLDVVEAKDDKVLRVLGFFGDQPLNRDL